MSEPKYVKQVRVRDRTVTAEEIVQLARHADVESVDDVVQIFRDNPAMVWARDQEGLTPLAGAAFGGHVPLVEWLLALGARCDDGDHGMRAPLHWAAREGHAEAAKRLLDSGADANLKNKGGETPLHWACMEGRTTVVQVLLERGADIHAKNLANETPLTRAEASSKRDVAELLREHAKTRGPLELHRLSLGSTQREARTAAAAALADLGDAHAIPPLLAYFRESVDRAAEAPTEGSTKQRAEKEVAMLREWQSDFGMAATRALARLADESVLPELKRFLGSCKGVAKTHAAALVASFIELARDGIPGFDAELKRTTGLFSGMPAIVKDAAKKRLGS